MEFVYQAAIRQSGVALVGAIVLVLVSPTLQARVFPPAGTAYVAPPPGYNLNIRSGPGTQYPAVNTLQRGTPITTTGYYEHGWAQLADRSWVAGNLINSVPVSGGSYGGATTAFIAGSVNVNIRSGPGIRYPVVNTLAPGTAITLTGYYEHGWAQLSDRSWVAGNLIQMGTPVTPLPPPTTAISLRVGMTSPLVVELEVRLRELNYVTSNFIADTYYGTDTEQAVSNFQSRNGLPVNGVADPETRRVLDSPSAIANPSVQPPPNPQYQELRIGDRNPDVLILEERLQNLNYFRGLIPDNYFDFDTETAVRNFQGRNGLTTNGVADVRTQEVLYSSGAIADPGGNNGGGDSTTDPSNPDPDNPIPSPGGQQATVTTTDGTDAIAFTGPGLEFDLAGFVSDGDTVTLTGNTENGWYELVDGNWIYGEYLSL